MRARSKAAHTGQRSARSKLFECLETEEHATIFNAHRQSDTARSRQRRHRPNGAEAMPESAHSRRLRPYPLLRLALPARRKTKPAIRPEFSALQRRIRSADARQLRLRLQPRTRPLGRERLRLPRNSLAKLRRYFLQQLLQERNFARGAKRRTNRRIISAHRKRRGLFPNGRSAKPNRNRQSRPKIQI